MSGGVVRLDPTKVQGLEGQNLPFSLDVNGNLRVTGGAGGGGSSDASAANQVTGNNSLASLVARTPALKRPKLAEGTALIATASTAQAANNAAPIVNANAVAIMAADANAVRRRVQNLGTATVYVRFNPTGDTTPAFVPAASGAGAVQLKEIVVLAAGAVWETPTDEDATGLVSACSATANQVVSFSAT